MLIDDEPVVLQLYERMLTALGYAVETHNRCDDALARLADEKFDVVLSDISTPGLDGIALLKQVREAGLDIPVILMTAGPALETAMQAVEHGAFRYLPKPIRFETLGEIVARAVRVHDLAKIRRQALAIVESASQSRASTEFLQQQFDRALGSLWMAFQPIVSWQTKSVFGYEALVRNQEPGLVRPDQLIEAAERLGSVHALGRAVRSAVIKSMPKLQTSVIAFVNLHAKDLDDEELFIPGSPFTSLASRIVLEITERAPIDEVRGCKAKIQTLRHLGFRIAIDDLGAGYAGLSVFSLIEPDVVKLDMSLVRDVDRDVKKQHVIRSMVRLCQELGILVIAEGIETQAERDALLDLGCDLLQGYLFGKPAAGFNAATF